MKIRIFALAKDLGLDSKVLIEHANNAGVSVKNSALASISPEEKDVILKYLEGRKSSPAAAEESSAPIRKQGLDGSTKVRNIEVPAARATATRKTALGRGESDSEGNGGVATAERPDAIPPADLAAELPPDDQTQDAAAAATEPPAEEPPPAAEDAEKHAAAQTDNGAGDSIRPDDYVSPAGAVGGGLREMKPRGTVPGSTPRRQRTKPRPQLPNIAVPPSNYVPPKPKPAAKTEPPAQKPDIPLTADALKGPQSPLREHLRQHRKRPEEGDVKTGGRRSGTGGGQEAGPLSRRRPQEQQRRRRRRPDEDFEFRGRRPRGTRRKRTGPIEFKSEAEVELPISIRSLSEATGR
ncbi:MAG: translation initiation factor IF-2 N-terminal domain-containing protein, partial [Planctomycetaceae bacterium]